MSTLLYIFFKQEESSLYSLPPIPYQFSFANSMSQSTKSNAFCKSQKNTSN